MNYDTMFFPKCLHFITAIQWISALGHFIYTFYIYILLQNIYIKYTYRKKSAHFNPKGVTATSLTLCILFSLTGYFSITFVNSVVQAISVLHFYSYKSEI